MADGHEGYEGTTRAGAEVAAPGASWRTMMATFVTRLERDHEALLEALKERLDEAEVRSRALEARLAALEGRGAMAPAALARAEVQALEARLAALEGRLASLPGGEPVETLADRVGALEESAVEEGRAAEDGRRRLELRLAALEETLRRHKEAAQSPPPSRDVPVGSTAPAAVPARSVAARPAADGTDPVVAAVPASRPSPQGPALAPPWTEAAIGAAAAGEGAREARGPGDEAAAAMLRRESEVLARAERGDAPREIATALGRGLGEVELVLRLAERAGRGRGGDLGTRRGF